MNCPICQNKLTTTLYNYMPELKCGIELNIPGIWDASHYSKAFIGHSMGQSYYVEEAIFLPFKITNHYVNHDMKKPYCLINKLVPKYPDTKDSTHSMAHFQKWKEVMIFPSILEIKPYRQMKERLKSILIFS